MKRITAIALLAMANFAMAGTAFAQSNEVRANVPFDFTVGDKLLPAGAYTIRQQSQRLIVIQNHDKPIEAFSLVNPDSGKSQNGGKLVFHRYGNQYFLSEILCSQVDMDLRVLPSKTEQGTALQQARLSARSETFIAAR